jgi:uncharacterized protein YdgA (DUF945 family)
MHVGDPDQDELYACMAKEPRAEGVFYKGTVDLTRSMANNDPALGMKALDTFVAFVVDLATEHEGDIKDWRHGKKLCPVLTEHKEKLLSVGIMIKELMNKDTTLKYENDTVMFNGQDVTDEVGIMVQAFQV